MKSLPRLVVVVCAVVGSIPAATATPPSNALNQTQGADRVDARRWREEVSDRLAATDIKALLEDVGPFLERPQDATMITRENLLGLLRR
jgi:chemotaxis regulatin CheY-phosphate phosphatase CheZ